MATTVTVKVYFEAAHRLHNPQRSDEWNQQVFGKCNNLYGHGHNYVLDAAVLPRHHQKVLGLPAAVEHIPRVCEDLHHAFQVDP